MRESLEGTLLENVCDIININTRFIAGTSPMLDAFDYAEFQKDEAKLWDYLASVRKNKNVVVSNAIWVEEQYTNNEETELGLKFSVFPNVLVRTPMHNDEPIDDLYKLFDEKIRHIRSVNDVQVYANALQVTKDTDYLVIPVAITGRGEGHQCVLILRRGRNPLWFDPNGNQYSLAKNITRSSTTYHTIHIIHPVLKMMQQLKNLGDLTDFVSSLPTLKDPSQTKGSFPWSLHGNTTVMESGMAQINGQSDDNWFLPMSGDNLTKYMNENNGICFTTCIVFILGLVCAKDPTRYLQPKWLATFHDTIIKDIPTRLNAEFYNQFKDFIYTMLHRSIMYHVYLITTGGYIPEDVRVVYFDIDKCMSDYNNATQGTKEEASEIAKASIKRELCVTRTHVSGMYVWEVGLEHNDLYQDLKHVFTEHVTTESGNLQISTNQHRYVMKDMFEKFAAEREYVLHIKKS